MLSFYLSQIPLGPTCPQSKPGWFQSLPQNYRFMTAQLPRASRS